MSQTSSIPLTFDYTAGLSTEEQLWIAERINAHVQQLTGATPPQLPDQGSLQLRSSSGSGFGRGFGMRSQFWSDSFDDD